MYCLNIRTILISLIPFVLSMDTQQVHMAPNISQRSLVTRALKDLKDCLPDFHNFKIYGDGLLYFISTPDFDKKVDSLRIEYFFEHPITIEPLNSRETYNTGATIKGIFNFLEKNRIAFMESEALSEFSKPYEYLLFEYMNTALKLIHDLFTDIERIKVQTDEISKEKAYIVANFTCVKLYEILLYVRCANLMDCIIPSSERYNFSVKHEFANNIYSIAITAMRELKAIPN